MVITVLNSNLINVAVIDTYESFIWTDRYNRCGDFQIYTPIYGEVPWYIKQEYILEIEESDHAMFIEDIEIKSDAEQGDHITIKGRSLESMLDRRIIWGQKNLNGNLQNGIKTLLDMNVINPVDPKRKIANFIFKESTDPKITKLTFEAQYKCDNLLEVIEKLCGDYNIGFRITFNEKKQFVFELYAGVDRSYDQFDNPYVVFSSKYDNLINSNYLTSTVDFKNVTLVVGEGEAHECKFVTVGDANVSDLARREMFTDASDISQNIDNTEYEADVDMTDPSRNAGLVELNPGGTGSTIVEEDNVEEKDGNFITTLVKEFIDLLPAKASAEDEIAVASEDEVIVASEEDSTTEQLTDEEYMALLVERGTEELLERTYTIAFEGEMDTSKQYKYRESFFMGDVVQFANEYGHEAKVRVTEFIMSHDSKGYSAYPTFTTATEGSSGGSSGSGSGGSSGGSGSGSSGSGSSGSGSDSSSGNHTRCFDYLTIADIQAILDGTA